MDELAALTVDEPLRFDPVLPPVSDVRRDDDVRALEARLGAAEAAVAESRWDDAVALLGELRIPPVAYPDHALRALRTEAWARMYRGELDAALELLRTAKQVAHRPGFNDVDRADVLYRIGCVRVKRGSTSRAVNDLTLALELCARSGRPCDRLRAEILEWRSRCYQRQRDFDAARADIEQALELAEASGDRHTAAHVNFRASAVAERNGQWLLARFYAEKAKDLYDDCGDRANVGRLLNNLGGLDCLLGKHEQAIAHLKGAVAIALDLDRDGDAAYAISSLAQVHLRAGQPAEAEPHARHALELLAGRQDALDEAGNVQLVLGRSLLQQERLDEAAEWFAAAEASFAQIESPSLHAAAWMAQGELALARGDAEAAAALYRRAAETLQDFNF
ncbi:MAG TPA: tetratricopeptide repeat protein [Gaiellaceae bacterium]|nr:tetratricopeptide repeat protein [Gaiellaceae bacterium]